MRFLTLALVCALPGAVSGASTAGIRPERTAPRPAYGEILHSLPLQFEENQGQFDASVRYFARSSHQILLLTNREAMVPVGRGVVRIGLKGANRNPAVRGTRLLPARSTYLIGNERSRWRSGVKHFEGVRYDQVYPGIDLVYYAKGNRLEYDFHVAPGADPGRIRVKFRGAQRLQLESDGALLVHAQGGTLRQPRPTIYQDAGVQGIELVEGRYRILGKDEVAFSIGEYDHARALVIDPVVEYATLLGGSAVDVATAAAFDATGDLWVAGYTGSIDVAVTGMPLREENTGGRDVFLMRLKMLAPDYAQLVYSTYIGGGADDEPRAIHVRGDNVYLAGVTKSLDFPLAGGSVQNERRGESAAFVMRLNFADSGADALWYSTYLGGDKDDVANAITTDADGRIYVAGTTTSGDFPLSGDHMQGGNRGGFETFFSLIDPSLATDALVYSTYLGSPGTDSAHAIALDAQGRILVAGYTISDDFPVAGDYRPYAGNGDAFLTRIDLSKPGLDALDYSTYFGGEEFDYAFAMALDAGGRLYLAGSTLSTEFPVTGEAVQSSNAGNADAFVAKFDLATSGAEPLYSTLLGGSSGDVVYAMSVGPREQVLIAGYTFSPDFPVKGATPGAYAAGADVFAAVVDTSRAGESGLLLSTVVGAELNDVAYAAQLDASGKAHIAGFTGSRSFPVTSDPIRGSLDGLFEAFLLVVAP